MFYLVIVFKIGYGATAVVMPHAYPDVGSCKQAVVSVEEARGFASWACVPTASVAGQ